MSAVNTPNHSGLYTLQYTRIIILKNYIISIGLEIVIF